jgi:hypothetical protein
VSEPVQYTIGAGVRCEEGECGSVNRVVIDPVARRVTHLVIDPGRGEENKLVPVGLVDDEAGGIKLACSAHQFKALEAAEEEQFLPGSDNELGYDPAQTMVWPYFGPNLALAGGTNPPPLRAPSPGRTHVQENVPAGEIQIRRGDRVEATDGEAGRVHGLVVDSRRHTVSHVLLSEGHLWGKKTVAVAITDVEHADAALRVPYTKQELKNLPELEVSLSGER